MSEPIIIKCWMYPVCRLSDRVMAVKLVLSDIVWNIISTYAPQVGCDEDIKNAFWNELESLIMKVPHKEKLVLATTEMRLVRWAMWVSLVENREMRRF